MDCARHPTRVDSNKQNALILPHDVGGTCLPVDIDADAIMDLYQTRESVESVRVGDGPEEDNGPLSQKLQTSSELTARPNFDTVCCPPLKCTTIDYF